MGQWGEAFGVPFAFEGLFFFTEAIFVAIYIYGWRRLKPWTHFWTGVPLVITGILGSVSVVAANAWMNSPRGFTLDSRRRGRRRRPAGGDLQRRHAADGRPHGRRGLRRRRVPRRVGLRRSRMLRGRRDRYHRLGFLIAVQRRPRSPSRSRWASATRSPAGSTTTSRSSSPPSSSCPRPRATCPRRCSAASTPTARSPAGSAIPGLASWLSDPSDGHQHRGPGPRHRARRRAADRSREVNTVHLAWDVMVGLGTLLFLLVRLVRAVLAVPAGHAQEPVVPARRRRAPASPRSITMEAGWVVSEVGRQPWIVYNL